MRSNQAVSAVHVDGVRYTVTHTVFRFEVNGSKKAVVVEVRGNDPWVPAIEDNKTEELGPRLVANSLEASDLAMAQALAEFGSDEELVEVFRGLERRPPDCSVSCCTHYPAMRAHLEKQYDGLEKGATRFIDQAAVVRELAKQLDPDAAGLEKGPLDLVLTIGSQNRGGVSARIDRSVRDGHATARSLYSVLDTTLRSANGNDDALRQIGSVRICAQDEALFSDERVDVESQDTVDTLQQQFEYVHRLIGRPISDRILEEQGLSGEFEADDDGHLVLKRVKPLDQTILREPSKRIRRRADDLPPAISGKIDGLAQLATLGERRGIDKLAALSRNGMQVRAAVGHLKHVLDLNREAAAKGLEPQRIAILTGFSVVDNDTGARIGGENDGPPVP